MEKKTRERLKEPLLLGGIFVVLSIVVGMAVPNSFQGAPVIEALLAVVAMAYGYAYFLHDELSKGQRLWISGIYFVAMTAITISFIFTRGVDYGTKMDSNGTALIVGITLGLVAIASLFVYVMLGMFSKLAYHSYVKKTLK